MVETLCYIWKVVSYVQGEMYGDMQKEHPYLTLPYPHLHTRAPSPATPRVCELLYFTKVCCIIKCRCAPKRSNSQLSQTQTQRAERIEERAFAHPGCILQAIHCSEGLQAPIPEGRCIHLGVPTSPHRSRIAPGVSRSRCTEILSCGT